MAERALQVRACRECGCTDDRACEGGCWWVLPDVCSSCAAALLTDAGLDATPVLLGGAVIGAMQTGGPAAVMGILAEVFTVIPAGDGDNDLVVVPDEHPGFEPDEMLPVL